MKKNKEQKPESAECRPRYYVKHPASIIFINLNDKRSPYITGSRLFEYTGDDEAATALRVNADPFMPPEKQTPIYLLLAFLECHKNGLYPPLWVLNRIAEAFQAYLGSFCKKDLEQLLGFKKGKQGRGTIFETLLYDLSNAELCSDMLLLRLLLKDVKVDCSIQEAAVTVLNGCQWKVYEIESLSEDGTTLQRKLPSVTSICDIYKRQYKKPYENWYNFNYAIEQTPQEKTSFFQRYAPHFPDSLKKKSLQHSASARYPGDNNTASLIGYEISFFMPPYFYSLRPLMF